MTALVRKAGSATEPGEVTITAQIWAGEKTFGYSADYFLVQNTQGSGTGMIINNVCMEAVRIA